MHTASKKFSLEIKGEVLTYHYYFSNEGTAYKSGLINLFIAADEPGNKAVSAIKVTVPSSYADKPESQIEMMARAEVLSFYSK